MKKLILSSLLATSLFAFAYTNTDANNADYLAQKNIIVEQIYGSEYRLDATITRAEAVAIALKIKGVQDPASYRCKKYFSDTVKNDWVCRAVEIAADNDLISRENKKFRPQDKITRAEALAIFLKAGGIKFDKYFPNDPEQNIYLDILSGTWQSDTTNGAFGLGIIREGVCDPKCIIPFGGGVSRGKFYPNRSSTRAEAFEFAKNILEYKTKIASGEVTTQ